MSSDSDSESNSSSNSNSNPDEEKGNKPQDDNGSCSIIFVPLIFVLTIMCLI